MLLFHYSQLDFRECLKAPNTVPKWHDQLNSSSNASVCELEVELIFKLEFELERELKLEINLELELLRDARRALELKA